MTYVTSQLYALRRSSFCKQAEEDVDAATWILWRLTSRSNRAALRWLRRSGYVCCQCLMMCSPGTREMRRTHIEALLDEADLQAQEAVDLADPLAVALCQVVIHRHHVHPLAAQGIEIRWQHLHAWSTHEMYRISKPTVSFSWLLQLQVITAPGSFSL